MFKFIKYFGFTLLLLTSFIKITFANESYDYTYVGKGQSGNKIERITPHIFNLEDEFGNIFNAYCIDYNYLIEDSWTYSITNVDGENFLDKEVTNKIRNVVSNSYPFETIENVRIKSNIPDLTIEEAISATQSALWYYANKYTFFLTGNTKKLYNFYLSLSDSASTSTKIAEINVSYDTSLIEGKLQTKITYSSDDAYDLKYSFDEDFINNNNITYEEIENGVIVKNLKENDQFNVYVSGKQKIIKDVYYYSPNGGRTASQSLVGVNRDIINVKVSRPVNVNSDNTHSLTIKKEDFISSIGIPNVTFEISNTADFSDFIYQRITDENGLITLNNIPSGVWYIKETKEAFGYLKTDEIFSITINNDDEFVTIKNNKMSKIKIIKQNELGESLEGVLFDLYKDDISKTNLIRKDVSTNQEGIAIIENLDAGKYILVETKTSDNHVLSTKSFNIDLEIGEEEVLEITNERISTGNLIIEKLDSENNKLLKGAKIGIYLDEDCTNLLKEITTEENLTILNIPINKYYIKEIKAPLGYITNDEIFEVDIAKDSELKITILNHRVYKTGFNNNVYSTTFVFTISLSTLIYLFNNLWKRKQYF